MTIHFEFPHHKASGHGDFVHAFEDLGPDQREELAILFRELKKANRPGGDLADVVDVLPEDHSRAVWAILRNLGGVTLGGIEEFVGNVPPAEKVLDILRKRTVKAYTYQMSSRLIRGSRPSAEKLSDLYRRNGVRSTINLCIEMHQGDDPTLAEAGLVGQMKSEHIQVLDNGRPTLAQVLRFLEFLENPWNTPAYVHCEQGVGRTGRWRPGAGVNGSGRRLRLHTTRRL